MLFNRVFGRRAQPGEREMQVEFLENCLIQIDGLEERVQPNFAQEQKAIWPQVWSHDDQAEDLLKKIALARHFANDLKVNIRNPSVTARTMWNALETLQGVIDNCETHLTTIMGSLSAKQRSFPNETRQ